MLKYSLRSMPVARRWKMGYVLATRVDGELVEAKINVKMDEFFRNPRITAEVKVEDGETGVCTFRSPRRVLERDQIGRITTVLTPENQNWHGFITPQGKEVGKDGISFDLTDAEFGTIRKAPTSGKLIWDGGSDYVYDVCEHFQPQGDQPKRWAFNVRKVRDGNTDFSSYIKSDRGNRFDQ